MKLSVVLATYNEENNLARCLNSVKNIADEIIVVDGESSDKTVNIAKQFGAKVIKTTNKPMFHTNKQMAINAATKDWILQLDADEVVDKQLKKSIEKIITKDDQHSAFYLKRKNFFLGRLLTKGGQYPDSVIRFFKKGKARLPQKSVHEQMKVTGSIGTLNGHLLHFTAPTFSRYLTNANRYTSLTAQELKQKHLPINLINTFNFIIIKPLTMFISLYIRHKGFIDGFPGFVFALFSGLHHPIAYMKYWELNRRQ